MLRRFVSTRSCASLREVVPLQYLEKRLGGSLTDKFDNAAYVASNPAVLSWHKDAMARVKAAAATAATAAAAAAPGPAEAVPTSTPTTSEPDDGELAVDEL